MYVCCTTCARLIRKKKTPFVFIHQAANAAKMTKDGNLKLEVGGEARKASQKIPAVLKALGFEEPVSLMTIMQAEIERAKQGPSPGKTKAPGVLPAQVRKELAKQDKGKERRTSLRKVRFEEDKETRKTGKPAKGKDKDKGGRRITVTLTAPDPRAQGFELAQDKSEDQAAKTLKLVARDLRVCYNRFCLLLGVFFL
ncbi:hypothetical protein BaRGS_00006880 [Batillaria attramentaria]|uniref:Uncharacterized protein n=1 Tax=Batillaria attramentaria TaxID=370345 RepID=A0ABD0LQK1_9CAEN